MLAGYNLISELDFAELSISSPCSAEIGYPA